MQIKMKRFLGVLLSVCAASVICVSGPTEAMASSVTENIPEDALSYNGHHYYVYSAEDVNVTSWDEAEAYCEKLGGHLATLTTDDENTAVYNYMVKQGYTSAYIGLSEDETERWSWVTGETSDYYNWAYFEPSNEGGDEDYAMFYYKYDNGQWNDGDFHSLDGGTVGDPYNFICEWEGTETDDSVDVYRLYNPNTGEHLYTVNTNEATFLSSIGWRYEGIGWKAPASGNAVIRLYNPNAKGGEHHYTSNDSEIKMLVAHGWKKEGVAFYSASNSSYPVYREYNPNEFSNNHNYTTSVSEHNWLISLGWRDEGIAFYAGKGA